MPSAMHRDFRRAPPRDQGSFLINSSQARVATSSKGIGFSLTFSPAIVADEEPSQTIPPVEASQIWAKTRSVEDRV